MAAVQDANVAQINAMAQQEMLVLPKIYGPNSINGPSGPPADLISALESLETTTGVDPTKLTGSQTVASVEMQTITDLTTLASSTAGEIRIVSIGAVSEIFIEDVVFNLGPSLAKAEPATVQDALLFTPGVNPPYTIVQPPPPPANGAEQFLVTNVTTGVSDWETGQAYSGPVTGVSNQFISVSTDNLNITATSPGSFIHTGAGNDAINVSQSTFSKTAPGAVNVLDGGSGSNFLVGNAIASNEFFLDDRTPTSPTASTIVNLKQGDSVTIFGVNKTDFQMPMADNQGAAGYTGLDIGFFKAGVPGANVVLTGYTSADLNAGKLMINTGVTPDMPGLPGSQYITITAAQGTFPTGFI